MSIENSFQARTEAIFYYLHNLQNTLNEFFDKSKNANSVCIFKNGSLIVRVSPRVDENYAFIKWEKEAANFSFD